MKWFLPLLLVPSVAWSAGIPVDIFDQSKLETLLRNIPSAFIKNETQNGFIRKHYQFPKNKASEFVIRCHGDYFGSATIPSYKACTVEVSSKDLAGDEMKVQVTDSSIVKDLNAAISYGSDLKKFYSTERVYGQSSDGAYKNLFRYSMICKSDSCDLVFVAKEANL